MTNQYQFKLGLEDVPVGHLLFNTLEEAKRYVKSTRSYLEDKHGKDWYDDTDNQYPYIGVVLAKPDWNWYGLDSRVWQSDKVTEAMNSDAFKRLLLFAMSRTSPKRKAEMTVAYEIFLKREREEMRANDENS